jgi:hypothetical protein
VATDGRFVRHILLQCSRSTMMRLLYVLPSFLVFSCGDDGGVRELPDAPAGSECPCEYLRACVENKCVERGGLTAAVVLRGTSINTVSACVMRTRSTPPPVTAPVMSMDGCDAYSIPTGTNGALWEPINGADFGTATLTGAGNPLALTTPTPGCLFATSSVAAGQSLTLTISGGADFPTITGNVPMPPAFTVPNRALVRGEPFELTWTPGDGSQLIASIAVNDGTTSTSVNCRQIEDDGSFSIPGELTALLGAGTATLQTSRWARDRDEMIAGDRVFELSASSGDVVDLQ